MSAVALDVVTPVTPVGPVGLVALVGNQLHATAGPHQSQLSPRL